ncbi:MAG: hypothetical protein JXR49_23315 [Acidobacteria bacterium]|nr:hypothetical protein [Acidobacteriota bacterium]
MAGILEKISGNVRIRNARTDLHLEFLRFRKFLENMKEIISINEDGKDKLQEEYIFDGHYVLSLLDGVVENAALMAFNASVLAPSARREIFRRSDDCRKFAQEEFLESPDLRMEKFPLASAFRDKDPETLLLSAVLNWFTGPLAGDQPAVMDFIRYVSDAVIGNCRKDALVEKITPFVGKVKLSEDSYLRTVDINETSPARNKGFVSLGEISCRPFGLMVLGFMERTVPGGFSAQEPEVDRLMIFDEEELSLRLRCDSCKIHLEASFSGDAASDFIFLYSRKPFDLRRELPRGFWVEETGQGTLAWIYDIPTDNLEKMLVQLGSVLLC